MAIKRSYVVLLLLDTPVEKAVLEELRSGVYLLFSV